MAGGSVNKVILIGRLGADPEVRYTPSGMPVANFRIATSESWNDKQGQRQEKTEWHRIVVWGKLAELCGQYLSKGRQVYVEGRLQTRQWDDRDGNKRFTTEVQAREVTFLGGRGEGGEGKRAPAPGEPAGDKPQATTDEPGFDYGPPPMSDDDVPF
ncbi:MAG: single-stranded DNA-binding protein [Deltaproteobacteria bacterium]|nr:single-stranded DNA-binding protein [Deltaproteobacteria bacterium]